MDELQASEGSADGSFRCLPHDKWDSHQKKARSLVGQIADEGEYVARPIPKGSILRTDLERGQFVHIHRAPSGPATVADYVNQVTQTEITVRDESAIVAKAHLK
jgi:hypothetical protein